MINSRQLNSSRTSMAYLSQLCSLSPRGSALYQAVHPFFSRSGLLSRPIPGGQGGLPGPPGHPAWASTQLLRRLLPALGTISPLRPPCVRRRTVPCPSGHLGKVRRGTGEMVHATDHEPPPRRGRRLSPVPLFSGDTGADRYLGVIPSSSISHIQIWQRVLRFERRTLILPYCQ